MQLAYTMTGTTSPLVTRMAERWNLTPEAGGTSVEWTVGARPHLLVRPLAPAMRGPLRAMFHGTPTATPQASLRGEPRSRRRR